MLENLEWADLFLASPALVSIPQSTVLHFLKCPKSLSTPLICAFVTFPPRLPFFFFSLASPFTTLSLTVLVGVSPNSNSCLRNSSFPSGTLNRSHTPTNSGSMTWIRDASFAQTRLGIWSFLFRVTRIRPAALRDAMAGRQPGQPSRSAGTGIPFAVVWD